MTNTFAGQELKLVLERCERKTLLGWRLLELPNRVKGEENRKPTGPAQ